MFNLLNKWDHEKQLKCLERAKPEIMKWAKLNNVNLCEVYEVVPFVENDFKTEIWIFYETDSMISDYSSQGISPRLEAEYLDSLMAVGYPEKYLTLITFIYDSKANVYRNFGSYYNRVR
jgi:hypothetical protein